MKLSATERVLVRHWLMVKLSGYLILVAGVQEEKENGRVFVLGAVMVGPRDPSVLKSEEENVDKTVQEWDGRFFSLDCKDS